MMDLEDRLRQLFDDDARKAPDPPGAARALRRARRRQATTAVVSITSVAAIVAASIVGARAILRSERDSVPGDRPRTSTINGISITYPEGWFPADPDALGLNGGGPETLPRLVLVLTNRDPHAQGIFGCPGQADVEPGAVLLTIQEEPLAVEGPSSVPWPVPLGPMELDEGSGDSACYPGWRFLRAGWTVEARTLEARVGIAPDASDADRDALFGAFESLRFAPARSETIAVQIASGTAAGQWWEIIASKDPGGIGLLLQYDEGGGGFSVPLGSDAAASGRRFGDDVSGEVIVFGFVPRKTVTVFVEGSGEEAGVHVLPEEFQTDLSAFVIEHVQGDVGVVVALDAEGNETGRARFESASH